MEKTTLANLISIIHEHEYDNHAPQDVVLRDLLIESEYFANIACASVDKY